MQGSHLLDRRTYVYGERNNEPGDMAISPQTFFTLTHRRKTSYIMTWYIHKNMHTHTSLKQKFHETIYVCHALLFSILCYSVKEKTKMLVTTHYIDFTIH